MRSKYDFHDSATYYGDLVDLVLHVFVYKDGRAALVRSNLWFISGSEGSRGGCGDPIAMSCKFDVARYMFSFIAATRIR